jgi:NAD(P)-dependent dehydrogenase (short-subunit alcohol dehydrogenase family)
MATKAIFITGGASGIGLAVARYFAAQGWRVGLADVNAVGLEAAKASLPAGMASTHLLDVRDRERWVSALTEFTGTSGGRLDVLFNNAGVAVGGPFAETPIEELDRLVAINFDGVMYGAYCGYPFLKATPGSCLLNTASAAGIYGVPGGAVYSATKFAVRGLTESLDAEWKKDGIKVRSLMPAFIETPLLNTQSHGSNQNVRERVREQGLEITPVEEVAKAAWEGVHGDGLHILVGKTARRLRFAVRWMPGKLRKITAQWSL